MTAPIRGVLLDVHGTLIDQGLARDWLAAAGADEADPELEAFLDRIWENARELDPHSLRDLSPADHYRIFHELLEAGPGASRELGDRLYRTMLDQWRAYADAIPLLTGLRAAGVRTALLSNVGVDIRGMLDREGLRSLADAVVLSFEIGLVKPDPRIFQAGADALGLAPQEVLMVGDSGKDDVGGVGIGIRTLIIPRTRGSIHGLDQVMALVLGSGATPPK